MPWDDPGRFGYLQHSPSTLSYSEAVSEVEIAISRELARSRCARSQIQLSRDRASSREIAISTSDTAFELLSVESEVCRYPKRPGSSIGDDVVENGAMRRMRSNRVIKQCEPQRSRSDPVRRIAPSSTTSSPMDDPGRFGYLQTSLSTLSYSEAVSEVEIAISRELARSRDSWICDLAHRDRASSREIAISTSDTASE